MATIFTKEVKDVHLEHSSGHTLAGLKFLAICAEILGRKGTYPWSPRVQNLTVFKIRQIGTRVWLTRVPCEVPESTKLGYQS